MTYAAHASETDHDVSLFGAERGLRAEVRQLEALVSELSVTLVVQGAWLEAMKHRRARPTEQDVDAALTTVADNVPEDIAERLLSTRDALVSRLRGACG
jgi:hypothetical protein